MSDLAWGDVTLYVSTGGKDGWSGATRDPKPDASDGPLRSLIAARDAIRAHRAKGEWVQRVKVLIAPGTYYLREPLDFDARDGGHDEASSVSYESENESPYSVIVSGGEEIKGFTPATLNGQNVWSVQLPDVKSGQWNFHQLFVNGERRLRPRLPKEGYYTFTGLPTWNPGVDWQTGQDQANFKEGQIRNWKNLADVEVVALSLWIESHMQLTSVDEAAHLAKFDRKSVFHLTNTHAPADFSRFYIENVAEALDTPGQWCLDRPSGTLYYYPKPGENRDAIKIVAPRLSTLMQIGPATKPNAQSASPLQYLHIRGLRLGDSEWFLPPGSAGWQQAAVGAPAAVNFENARNCSLENCHLSNLAAYGIEVKAGSANNVIQACTLRDLGAGGIKIDADSSATTVSHCDIGPGGEEFHSAVGVLIGGSGDNTITHNHIHDLYYTGVSLGWSWGYELSKAVRNIVEFNDIHDIGKGMLSDMGGIYTLGVSPGTTLRNNRIHDITASNYGGWGIYLDEGSSGILVENNIVYRTSHGGFHQHYGENNIVRNNIFAFGNPANGQIIRTREENHASFFFEHNLVYFNGGPLFGSSWGNNEYRIDYNDYWDTTKQEIKPIGLSWSDWQKRGHDVHSIIADPHFKDPEHGDFTLTETKAAQQVGFIPIDAAHIGTECSQSNSTP